jgi:anaerobic magnesium-protoporphyrin IX monomethyl ester cyclase
LNVGVSVKNDWWGSLVRESSMKVLFVVPPEKSFIESYVAEKVDKGREFRQKLGLLYVAAYLRKSIGITPAIVDCLAEGYEEADLERLVFAERPDLVGFSVLTFNLLDCLAAAAVVKHASPETKICFGGFHPTLFPLETVKLPNVDFVVFGEGERTFSELVKHLLVGSDEAGLATITGLAFKSREGQPVLNGPREPIKRLDDLPLPAHDLINLDKYTFVLAEESKVGAIQTSRGCPSKCVFCDIRMTPYRFRSAESVLEEIGFLISKGVTEFFAVDDTFTINRNRVLRLCELIKNEKIKIRYKISSRVDRVDDEMLHSLAESGCYRIHFGVESGSQRILDYLQKGVTVAQVVKAFELTKKAGIQSLAYMMLGVPSETLEDIKETFQLVRRIMPDHVNYSICTPFPKTCLYEEARRLRLIDADYWQEFAERPDPHFRVRTLNEYFDETALRQIQDKALRHFYMSPRVIFRELSSTKSIKQVFLKAKMGIRVLLPR